MQRVRSLGEVEARADALRRKKGFYANTIFNKTKRIKSEDTCSESKIPISLRGYRCPSK